MKTFCLCCFVLILAFSLGGCDKKKMAAYGHLKRARELRNPGVTYIKADPVQELKEYELAYQISSKEFNSWDYERISHLYLTVRKDKDKAKEFEQKSEEKAKEEGPTRRMFDMDIFTKFGPK